jgi:hypothetical protein
MTGVAKTRLWRLSSMSDGGDALIHALAVTGDEDHRGGFEL